MNFRYWQALALAAAGVAAIVWTLTDSDAASTPLLVVASAAVPLAVLLLVTGRLDGRLPVTAVVGGGVIGPVIAVVGHAVVFAAAYTLFAGFADAAVDLLDTLRIDPRLTAAAGSPWTILFMIHVVIVAPLTEEVGKAIGAGDGRPTDRRSAFLAGVGAGAGFAVVENILYVSAGAFFGPSWEAIALGRMLGAAIHPLASGLVVMAWWEWRQARDGRRFIRQFVAGVGVHAVWNGSIVALSVVATAYQIEALDGLGAVSLAYSGVLGVVAAALLWRLTVSVADGNRPLVTADAGDARVVGAWTVLAASLLIPVALLLVAFPTLAAGG